MAPSYARTAPVTTSRRRCSPPQVASAWSPRPPTSLAQPSSRSSVASRNAGSVLAVVLLLVLLDDPGLQLRRHGIVVRHAHGVRPPALVPPPQVRRVAQHRTLGHAVLARRGGPVRRHAVDVRSPRAQ